tara:strand:- start:155 stop:514 length:360 start_codon:yes stop_codon:yes gene_type:complete
MGIFSSDNVGNDVRNNTELVDSHMRSVPKIFRYNDFIFEYLYTTSEPITEDGKTYGSAIYIRIESSKDDFYVSSLPVNSKEIQEAIDKHQEEFGNLPGNLSKSLTKWLYFNMATVFRIT